MPTANKTSENDYQPSLFGNHLTSPLQYFEDQFYDLHTGIVGNHERPHKPVMLLAVMDLIELKVITNNLIPFSDQLRQRFTHYFDIVRKSNDSNTPINPFSYMRKESFWNHVATTGNQEIVKLLPKAPGIAQTRKLIAGASLDEKLWLCLQDNTSRAALRDVLISRYFPSKRNQLINNISAPLPNVVNEDPVIYDSKGRSAGFRKVVVQVYEHQCAACGVRIRLPNGQTIVDAAHIIPFAETKNDHPCNGMALCKNHHWAMDRQLIAPTPDLRWVVNQELDDRQAGEKELIDLAGKRVIVPKEKAYQPNADALAWRHEQLLRA